MLTHPPIPILVNVCSIANFELIFVRVTCYITLIPIISLISNTFHMSKMTLKSLNMFSINRRILSHYNKHEFSLAKGNHIKIT